MNFVPKKDKWQKLSPEEIAKIEAYYGTRATAAEVAQMVGIRPERVTLIWSRYRIRADVAKRDSALTGFNAVRSLRNPMDSKPINPAFMLDPLLCDPLTDQGVTFDDKSATQCSWPLGRDSKGERRFCGESCAKNARGVTLSYCAPHDRKSRAPEQVAA